MLVSNPMRVALIHDWLTGMRGGESCLEVFCELFPDADLYTLVHLPENISATINAMPIRTSFIQKLPFCQSRYRHYLPLFPLAVESFDLRGYDLVLSSSHCVAKGVISDPEALHISYVHTPMRYIWEMYGDYFGPAFSPAPLRSVARAVCHYLRMWDETSSRRVDLFVANSHNVARRIQKRYRREARVIHPPVDTTLFEVGQGVEDYYLIVSALVPYKRIDLAVKAFSARNAPLKVVGTGTEDRRLRKMAGPTVEFLGRLSHRELKPLYASCRALLMPGEEDFGIVPLEAMASGRPVIAYGKGGATETVVPMEGQGAGEPTGLFFHEPTPDSLNEAIDRFEQAHNAFEPLAIRRHAERFGRDRFKEEVRTLLDEAMASRSMGR